MWTVQLNRALNFRDELSVALLLLPLVSHVVVGD